MIIISQLKLTCPENISAFCMNPLKVYNCHSGDEKAPPMCLAVHSWNSRIVTTTVEHNRIWIYYNMVDLAQKWATQA